MEYYCKLIIEYNVYKKIIKKRKNYFIYKIE